MTANMPRQEAENAVRAATERWHTPTVTALADAASDVWEPLLSSAVAEVNRLRDALAYIAYGNAGLNAEQARLHAAEALDDGSQEAGS